jgi:hypothetical protein
MTDQPRDAGAEALVLEWFKEVRWASADVELKRLVEMIAAHTEAAVKELGQFAEEEIVELRAQLADLAARLAAAEEETRSMSGGFRRIPGSCSTHEGVPFFVDDADATFCPMCEYAGTQQEIDTLKAERDRLAAAARPPDMCQCGRSSSDAVGDAFQDHESTCATYLQAKVRVMADAHEQVILQRDTLKAERDRLAAGAPDVIAVEGHDAKYWFDRAAALEKK